MLVWSGGRSLECHSPRSGLGTWPFSRASTNRKGISLSGGKGCENLLPAVVDGSLTTPNMKPVDKTSTAAAPTRLMGVTRVFILLRPAVSRRGRLQIKNKAATIGRHSENSRLSCGLINQSQNPKYPELPIAKRAISPIRIG